METKESHEKLFQSRLSFFHLGRFFSSDRDDSRDSDDYWKPGFTPLERDKWLLLYTDMGERDVCFIKRYL